MPKPPLAESCPRDDHSSAVVRVQIADEHVLVGIVHVLA
eukprot:CAMPEP_0182834160 /NCGR_PEP_ID=MMETSP0006_2-20121128/20756_1 /TAXON_ID=97485 /ORGANISM="Prymnesium parvum, Strain Texoma1" /LENGTH=38 /DNA_ID= /DNA_START= /DNA_END= /DNA_ORIENTATION=